MIQQRFVHHVKHSSSCILIPSKHIQRLPAVGALTLQRDQIMTRKRLVDHLTCQAHCKTLSASSLTAKKSAPSWDDAPYNPLVSPPITIEPLVAGSAVLRRSFSSVPSWSDHCDEERHVGAMDSPKDAEGCNARHQLRFVW